MEPWGDMSYEMKIHKKKITKRKKHREHSEHKTIF